MADEEISVRIKSAGIADFMGDIRTADKAISDFVTKIGSAGETASKSFSQMGQAVSTSTTVFLSFAKAGGQVAQAGDSVSKSVLVAGSSFAKSANEVTSFGSKLASIGGSIVGGAVAGLEKLGSAAISAGGHLISLGGNAASVVISGLAHVGSSALSVIGHLTTLGFHALEAGAKFAIGFAKTSIDAFQGFDNAMQQVAAVTNDFAGKTMTDLTNAAIDVGVKYPISTKAAAEGLVELAKAGFNAAEQIQMLDPIVQLQGASNMTLANTTELVSGTMRAFHIEAGRTAEVTDTMAQAANQSSIDLSDLKTTFSYMGPAAYAAGYSFQDMSTATAVLGNNMIKGSSAGTGLRAIITSFAAPGKNAAGAFQDLGIQTKTAEGKLRPFGDVLSDLRVKFAGLSDAQQIEMAKNIAGQTQFAKLLALVKTSQGDYDTMTAAINNSSGAAGNMATTMRGGLTGAVENFKGTIEALQIKLVMGFKPVMLLIVAVGNDLITMFSGLVDKAAKFGPTQKTATDALITFRAALAGNWSDAPGIGKLARAFGLFGEVVHTTRDVIITFASALGGNWADAPGIGKVARIFGDMGLVIHKAVEVVSTDIKAFRLGLSGEWIPAGIHTVPAFFAALGHDIVAGLRTAGEIIHAFRLGLSGEWVPASIHTIPAEFAHIGNVISGFVKTAARDIAAFQLGLQGIGVGNSGGMAFFNKLGEAISQIAPKVGPVISKIVELYQAFSPLSNAFAILSGFLEGGFRGGLDAAGEAIVRIGKVFGVDLTGPVNTASDFIMNTLLPTLGQVGNFVTGTVLPALGQFGSFISTNVLPALGQLGEFIFSTVIPAVQQFGQWLSTNIGPILGSIGQTMQTTVIPALQQFGGFIMTQVVPAVQSLATWIGNNVVPAIEKFAGFIASTVIPIIGQLAAFVMNEVIPVVFQFAQGIAAFLQPILERVSAFIVSTVIPALTQIGEFIQSTVIPALTQIYEYISANVMPIFITVAGFLGGALADAFTLIADVVTVQWNIISTVVSTVWDVMSGIFNEIASFLQDPLGTTFTLLSAIVSAAWDAISGYVSAAWSVLSGIFNEIISSVTGTLGPVWDTLSGMVSTAWDAISGFISAAWGTISGIFGEVVSFVGGTLTSIWDTLSGAISGVWNTITSAIGTAVGNILTALGEIVTGIGSVVGQAAAQAVQIGTGIIGGIVSGLAGAAGQVISFLGGLAQQALGSVLSVFGIHSPSTVFAEVGGNIMKGMVLGIQGGAGQVNNALVSTAQGALKATMDAMGIHSGSTEAKKHVGENLTEGMADGIKSGAKKPKDAAKQTALDILSEAEKVISNISKAVGSGVSAISKLKNYTSANMDAINQFASDLTNIVLIFQSAATKFTEKGLEAATKFTDAVFKITNGIEGAVKGLAALATYSAVNQDMVNIFVSDLINLTLLFENGAKYFKEKGLAAATAFADAAFKITGGIENAVKGLTALSTYSGTSQDIVNVFVSDLINLTILFVEASKKFEEDGLKAAVAFAESVSKITSVIGNGVKALTELAGYKTFASTIVDTFMQDLNNLVIDFVESAGWFDEKSLKAAAVYAESVGKMVAIIGNGVKGLTDLASYKEVATTIVDQFMKDLNNLVGDFIESAGWFDANGLKAATLFADAAGKIVGIVANGAKAFTELAQYQKVPPQAIQAFVEDISLAVSLAAEATAKMNGDMLVQVGQFGDATGKLFNGFKAAMDVFASLRTFKSTPSTVIREFIDEIIFTVGLATELTKRADKDLIEQTVKFSEAIGKIFSGLKSALELFKTLETFKGIPPEQIKLLLDAISKAVVLMAQAHDRSLQFKERALDFENDLKAGFLSIREAASIALETARKAAQTVAEVDAIPNPPDKKPPEGGSKGGGGSGKPPGAALGGIIGSAGAVMVGEKGPEIVFLPKGATVLNHQISMELLGGLATVQPPPSQSQIYNSVANSYSNRTYAPQYNLHLNSEQSTGNIITDFNILKALA